MQQILTAARKITGTFVLGTLVLASAAFAQGGNDCGSPTAIAGFGTFSFDNASATTGPQGQNNALCNQFGAIGITNDVWFDWTAGASQSVQVSTCGGTFMDSKVAVYAGAGCPGGAPLACNDDSCGARSTVTFAAVAGNVYSIQLGNFPGSSGSTGTFSIQAVVACGVNTGPDVIVGDLHQIENNSPTGALDALSLGTVSCNVGTVNLSWQANTNQHPVIGGNLYRYRVVDGSGRLEQIGMSWLKHGFFALSQQLCCSGCQGTDGTTLGVNCSDPYSANRNGGQSGLGPRRQVNAHTGFFTFPPASPSWSGTTARRCEFLLADAMVEPGVRYFGEGQYVSPDDAAAGNQNNNASYRELSIGGTPSNRSFSFVGGTQREKSAIRAWPLADPGTVLTNVQVPGEGLFIVGHHATDLGGGQHHYEYAVYNMNSDRSAGSFSVPIPAGVNVTNIGFHDIAYRNGDGEGSVTYSGADWTATLVGGSLTWACETQAANANANALRWGTTYNFRFDADAGPASVAATLGLWKTGSPGSVAITVDGPDGGSTSFGYCFGDGSGTSCPCGNNSSPFANAGCLNSLGSAGQLVANGSPSVSADTLALVGSGMPDSSALYFQGTVQTASGAGAVFGDGLRCVAGSVIRLGTKTNAGGSSQFPSGADPLVSVKGAVAPGNVRTYQVWYRNAAAFCNAETFNLTNGWQLAWLP